MCGWIDAKQDFQTNNYFAEQGHQPKPDYSRQQYGGSFGGPIIENKAFYFGAVELVRMAPDRTGHAKPGTSFDGVFEQRGLADAWLSMHHQDAAAAAARTIQQPVERLALSFPAEQLPLGRSTARRRFAHLVRHHDCRPGARSRKAKAARGRGMCGAAGALLPGQFT